MGTSCVHKQSQQTQSVSTKLFPRTLPKIQTQYVIDTVYETLDNPCMTHASFSCAKLEPIQSQMFQFGNKPRHASRSKWSLSTRMLDGSGVAVDQKEKVLKIPARG